MAHAKHGDDEASAGPGRREATEVAILDAAEELFSAEGYDSVSVRDIARRAGVSHALVHRYLGRKADVYRAVLQRNEELLHAAAGGSGDLREAVLRTLREGMVHRRYLRIIALSVLHGLPFETTMGRFPATQGLVAMALAHNGENGDEQRSRFAVAALISLFLGWITLEPWLTPAAGLDGIDQQTVLEGLERIMLEVIDAEVPGGDPGSRAR